MYRPMAKRRTQGWMLWWQWVLATVLAEMIGAVLVSSWGASLGRGLSSSNFIVLGIVEGAVLGLSQWLVLQRHLTRAFWWIPATMGGGLIAWLIGLMTIEVFTILTCFGESGGTAQLRAGAALAVGGVALGAVLGFAQWLVLRPFTPKAVGWILASALAWGLALVMLFQPALKTNSFDVCLALSGVFQGAVVGLVVGAITGAALVWLFSPRFQKS